MRSANSMFALAKASALKEGPRIAADTYGYALTRPELTKLYAQEGYNITPRQGREPAMENHLRIWEAAGRVRIVGQLVFFELTPEEQTAETKQILEQYRHSLVPGASE